MKTSTLILIVFVIGLVAAFAFQLGSISARMARTQADVNELNVRVSNLEYENNSRKLNWKWLKHIGSYLPIVGKYFDRE